MAKYVAILMGVAVVVVVLLLATTNSVQHGVNMVLPSPVVHHATRTAVTR